MCALQINPLTLRAAKTGLTILEISNLQTHFLENIWRRNVDHKPNKNSPSNILLSFALFKRYFQKYESSRRHFLEKLPSVDGLRRIKTTSAWKNQWKCFFVIFAYSYPTSGIITNSSPFMKYKHFFLLGFSRIPLDKALFFNTWVIIPGIVICQIIEINGDRWFS